MNGESQDVLNITNNTEIEPQRKRGRPRKAVAEKHDEKPAIVAEVRKRGRPKGAKNKQPNQAQRKRYHSTNESIISHDLISENDENESYQYAATQPNPSLNLHNSNSRQLPGEGIKRPENNTYSSSNYIQPNLPDCDVFPSQVNNQKWGNLTYEELHSNINKIYEEIVHFRKNTFNIPSGKAGKSFIFELTFWLKQFNSNSALNSIALKAFMILPSLILQKPSATSKSKDHVSAVERRLTLWKQGELNLLMKEVEFIQSKLKSSKKAKSVEEISKCFANLVMQGKLSAAIKLLDRESSSGVLPLSPDMLEELKQKHPPAAEIAEESLLHGPLDTYPQCIFDQIDEAMIYASALRTKGSAGPSGMDAELYRRILCSKSFKSEGKLMREEIATMTRNLLKTSYHPSLLEAYTSCRLIPLDKNPGVRPIGIGEVLRRIIGKTVSAFLKEEIKESAGPLQVCAGYNAGAEAAIHAMGEIFIEEETDGVLLIDASNAFNQMNRSAALHNIQFICKELSLYLINTYRSPSRLFIQGGSEISSQEGTTQGDPLAMPWYSINTSLMINLLRTCQPTVKQVWFADDSAGAGKISALHDWYEILSVEGLKYGYHVNGSKTWLIAKSQELASEAVKMFEGKVNISTEGKRHLGAVIGSKQYKDEYCKEKINKWKEELELLSVIGQSHPHAAYIAYTKAFKSKFTFYMRTIESFEEFVDSVDDVLSGSFLPTLFGQDEPLPEKLLEVITPTLGGLGVQSLKEEAPKQIAASKVISEPHVKTIRNQSMKTPDPSEELKKQQQSLKSAGLKSKMNRIDAVLSPDLLTHVNQARDKGASSWLNALPLKDQGLALNKQEFRDSLRLRYNMPLKELPSHCTCGSPFSVNHALSCKKGGFVAQRHDGVRDLLTNMLDKVCVNVESEPRLIPLDNEKFDLRSTNTNAEARLDIKAGSFWSRGVTAFFDVRVTHVNSSSNTNKTTATIFKEQEQEKKRKYHQRILDVEMGTFTPLVFGTNGGMGSECQIFLKNLTEKLSTKTGESYAETMTWIRTRLRFQILKSTILCIRGSRTPFKNRNVVIDDFKLNNFIANVI